MNEKDFPDLPKSTIIDRRYFLKASSTAVAIAVAGVSISEANGATPTKEEANQNTVINSEKMYKAGWMAF